MKRTLITGASGEIGRVLSRAAVEHTEVLAAYHQHPQVGGGEPVHLNLLDGHQVDRVLARLRPDLVIHAAISDRNREPGDHRRSAAHLAQALRRNPARLLVLSTDMVFDGCQPPYSEEAVPQPCTPYGAAKVEMEGQFAGLTDALIVRTSLVYDFSEENRQLSWMLERIRRAQPVPLFTDEIRHPIWVQNLCSLLLRLGDMPEVGLLHLAGPQSMSRLEFGTELLSIMGIDPHPHVNAVKRPPDPPRPGDLRLDLSKARALLGEDSLLSLQQASLRR